MVLNLGTSHASDEDYHDQFNTQRNTGLVELSGHGRNEPAPHRADVSSQDKHVPVYSFKELSLFF